MDVNYAWKNALLWYAGKIMVHDNSFLKSSLQHEYHANSLGVMQGR